MASRPPMFIDEQRRGTRSSQLLWQALVGRSPWTARDAFVPLLEAEAKSRRGREMPIDRTRLSQARTHRTHLLPHPVVIRQPEDRSRRLQLQPLPLTLAPRITDSSGEGRIGACGNAIFQHAW